MPRGFNLGFRCVLCHERIASLAAKYPLCDWVPATKAHVNLADHQAGIIRKASIHVISSRPWTAEGRYKTLLKITGREFRIGHPADRASAKIFPSRARMARIWPAASLSMIQTTCSSATLVMMGRVGGARNHVRAWGEAGLGKRQA